MTGLDRSLGVDATGPGEWRANADPAYEATNGQFGGWSAALLLRAPLAEPRASGTPSALTIHFLSTVPPGRELSIRTELRHDGRSLSFWQAELRAKGQPELLGLATLVLSNRRESDRFDELRMPVAPDPESLERFRPPAGRFGERMDLRPVIGHPPFDQATTRSVFWVREETSRAVDAVQLSYLADVGAPRIFLRSSGPRPSATLTLSIYFHATAEEVAAVGDDYVLSELNGTRAEASTFGSRGELWSRQGKLLATMEQLCWFI